MTQPLLQAADLRGAARLTTDAVAGLGEGAAADERTHGVTAMVYETVRGVRAWLAPRCACWCCCTARA